MPLPYDLLRAALRGAPARPFVTFYDDATGERVELSVATFDNWVAKIANLLQDGLVVEPGERVGLVLPLHWQTLAIATACWAVGAVVALDEPGDVCFAAADRVDEASGAREVVALSLLPLGPPLRSVPPGVLDFAVEVPSYGDRFAALSPVSASTPAVVAQGQGMTQGELVASAPAWPAGARGLVAGESLDVSALQQALIAPLACDGSVVLCRHLDAGALDARRTAERVTHDVH